jgi:hypothetical protein
MMRYAVVIEKAADNYSSLCGGWYRGGVYRPCTAEVVGRHAVAA